MPAALRIVTLCIRHTESDAMLLSVGSGSTQHEALENAFSFHAVDASIFCQEVSHFWDPADYQANMDTLNQSLYGGAHDAKALEALSTVPNIVVEIFHNTSD